LTFLGATHLFEYMDGKVRRKGRCQVICVISNF